MLEDALRRLKVLIFSRALVATLLFGSFYFFGIGKIDFPNPEVFSYFIAALYFLTLLYAVILRKIRTLAAFTAFAYIQITIDIFSEVTFVFFTGGIESWFTFMFLLSIISSSIILNRRASYATASLCSILYGLLIEFQFYYQVPLTISSSHSAQYYLYNVFTHILAFYMVAFLSGNLSERLRTAIRTLHQKDAYIDHLKAISKDIIESMPSGIFTTDLDRKIDTFNSSAQKITGKTKTEVIGRTPQEIFPFLKGKNKTFERVEGEIQGMNGAIYVGLRISSLKNSEDVPIGMIGIFQDLTKIKAMEMEMQKKEKWAFIGELSALIAHELRNPLASLKASVEMLKEKKVSEINAEQLMNIAITEMDRLNGIITDFLIYAKPQQQRKDTIDLHQSLTDLITLLKNSITKEKDITISTKFNGKLFVTVDAKQLKQVFWNLGINAIDAIADKGRITVSTEKKDSMVEIEFRDTGSGIINNDRDRIFYPFFTTKEKGTGLGLSIAQRIIEEHGGKIQVESPGESLGTVFKVILPKETMIQKKTREAGYGEKIKG
ncbi:MAG: PAS domain S-box protein [Nitrospiraceae bacterium]|nr:MAG: PAS domain S-box protein [Nitrospiraceae bacterium]